jgi:hypothetical protein
VPAIVPAAAVLGRRRSAGRFTSCCAHDLAGRETQARVLREEVAAGRADYRPTSHRCVLNGALDAETLQALHASAC